MRVKCGPTRDERRKAKGIWHRWFAWHPVRVEDGRCLWLETLMRRGEPRIVAVFDHGMVLPDEVWFWQYREMPSPTPDGATP